MEENKEKTQETLITEPETKVETVVEPDVEEKVADKAEETEKKEEKPSVPDKYEFTLPEGVALKETLVEEASPIFKELNLTQEQAQKLVNLQVKHEQDAYKAQVEAWETTTQNWRKAAESDPEYGGAKFKDSLAVARRALTEFGTKELREALDLTGTGNHPEILRFFYRIGKAISEDTFKVNGKPATSKSVAELLFGN